MFFDTDVVIAFHRGVVKAARILEDEVDRRISILTYMEVMAGARNKEDARLVKAMIADLGLKIIPLNENIGHRAASYVEQYSMSDGIGIPDALIAATAVEHGHQLTTGNVRHFRTIKELTIRPFLP